MSLTDERITDLWDSHIKNWKLTGKTLINPIVFARLIAQEVTKPQESTAKEQYEKFMEGGEENRPVERLRFFLSLALNGQDWIDVEPFIDDITNQKLFKRCAELEAEIERLGGVCEEWFNEYKAADKAFLSLSTITGIEDAKKEAKEIFRNAFLLALKDRGFGDGQPGWLECFDERTGKVERSGLTIDGEIIFGLDAIQGRYEQTITQQAERIAELEAESAYHFQLYQDLGEVSCLESDYQEREYQEAKRSAIVTARKLAEQKQAERIAEIEADVESLTEENDSRLETSIKQHARIMALESERDALAMQNKALREALESCIADLEGGFIQCERCGDQEDTKDMDVLPIMRNALALPDNAAEIIKRHDADKKDAERYRWLRDESNQTSEDSPCVSDASWGTFFGEALDAAIDAELEKS